MKRFEDICRMSQSQVKTYLTKYLKSKYNEVTSSDGFIYAKGTFPVLLVAHMDTVHKESVKQIVYSDGGDKVSSPQGIGGDDRTGVYMIMQIVKTYNCSVLFTEDEEIGCIGASKFVKALRKKEIEIAKVNYMIELDRKGANDAVFYECDNPEFERFILQDDDWELKYGSYTDIVELEPEIGVAGVNFSCGYYKPHTTDEYVVMNEMKANIDKVKKLLGRTNQNKEFEFIEAENGYYGYSCGYGYYDYELKAYYVAAQTKNGKYIEEEFYAMSEAEAIGLFMESNPDICYNDLVEVFCEE
jgi:hypothetical protein